MEKANPERLPLQFKYEVCSRDSCIEGLIPKAAILTGEAWRDDWVMKALTNAFIVEWA